MSAVTVKTVRRSELGSKKWSGGITTQLAIWPEGADYASRKFDWRISSAVVEEDESTFTKLPGIHRWLMLLSGGIELTHESMETKFMKPLADVSEFEGEWTTTSKGRCVDFNLMTAKGFSGATAAVPAGKSRLKLPGSSCPKCWKGILSVTDGLKIEISEQGATVSETLNSGDFMLLSYAPDDCGDIFLTTNPSLEQTPAVIATVWQLPEGMPVVWSE